MPRPSTGARFVVVGLLDVVDALDLRELGEHVVRHVERRAGRDVVEEHRLVGGARDLLEVAAQAAAVGLVVVRRDRQDRVGAELGGAGRSSRTRGACRSSPCRRPPSRRRASPGPRARSAAGARRRSRVGASPVVPQTTTPSEPCAQRWRRSSTNASSSTRRSSSNGVTIAVRMAPRSAMRGTVSARSTAVGRVPVRSAAVPRADGRGDGGALRPRRRATSPCSPASATTARRSSSRARSRMSTRASRRRLAATGAAIRATARSSRSSASACGSRRARPRVLAYLNSIKHVGIRGAAWLVDRHGGRACSTPSTATRTARCARSRASASARSAPAVRSWEEQGALRAVRLFLEGHGVPAAAAARHLPRARPRRDRDAADRPVRDDRGRGDRLRDRRRAGPRARHAARRAGAASTPGCCHALHQAEGDGHCHLPREEVLAPRVAAARGRRRGPPRRAGRLRASSSRRTGASRTR